ncbi:hypothetical protein [Streptomyces sp. NPDC001744]|uniref:hypothetical protein n=1 Tax=Streptomyces sp. NPDC001744 TaxID=3364606 RepID=UPI00367F20FF
MASRPFTSTPPTPAPATDTRDEQNAVLHAALWRAVSFPRFAAGGETVADPRQPELLSPATGDPTNVLDRTAP